MNDADDKQITSKSSSSNKPKAAVKGKGSKISMANARKLGATVLNTAVSLAAAPGDAQSRSLSRMDINAPDAVAMVLGWLTDRKQIIVIRDSSGKPVAGVVTYNWLKRRMDEKDRRVVEGNTALSKAVPKRATSASKSTKSTNGKRGTKTSTTKAPSSASRPVARKKSPVKR